MGSLIFASVAELAYTIRTRRVSAVEVVDAHLQRIAQVNPQINAVVTLAAERARAEARAADAVLVRAGPIGPLHGVPITIKDNLDTAGVRSTGGTQGRANFIPQQDATVVARLRSAGAILLGKTNTPELTLSFETDCLLFGRTSNPYDLARSSGGSSGGAAAIIAADGSPLDLGSDTGGSIRVPSHMCGVAGIRPTSGRVPRTGHIIPPGGMLDSLTTIGPMARFVDELILTLPLVAGVDWRDPAIVPVPLLNPAAVQVHGLRVALHTDRGIRTPDSGIVHVVKQAADALANAGARVTEAVPPGIEQSPQLYERLSAADSGWSMAALLQQYGTTEVSASLANWLPFLREMPSSAANTSKLLLKWDAYRSSMLSFMERYDVIVCPPCAFTALPHGKSEGPEREGGFSYTEAYNLTGWPGVVVRCGTSSEGLPIGVQVVAQPWREDVALAVAKFLETTFGGWQRPALLAA
jgi:amidase